MAITLDAFLAAISIYSRTKNPLKLSTTLDGIQRNLSYSFTDGAGANQMDAIWSDERTIAASGTDDLDLAGGLTDAFGAVITFARVKFIYLEADATNSNNVLIGGAAANQFLNWLQSPTDKVLLTPGGMQLVISNTAAGYAVVAGTGDILRVANGAGGSTVKYRIILGGSLT
jgi:hypothetical protein